ncbi:MAG: glycosyltransferase [Peptococcaceae bacterium]|jgi:glycosyltransferase involved in cell wall biosynthesis|nr:glycosyltransferase [Peptococcaceae bacterium]
MARRTIAHMIGGGDYGGAEQHVLTLLTHLNREIFRPVCICLQKGLLAERAEQEGVPVRYLPMGSAFNVRILPAFIRTLREFQVDLLHNHGARANLIGRLGATYLHRPNISTVHSSLAFDYLTPSQARAALLLDRWTAPLSSGNIAVSQYLADEITARGAKNIRVIYNAYQPNDRPATHTAPSLETRREFRRLWQIERDAVVIGTIARLHPAKGLRDLIAAASLLQSALPQLHLLLVSHGPLHQEISAQAQAAGLSLTITGFISDIPAALAAMDLFVLPSLSEGMGLVLLEAMQAGRPIVATRVGGIPELIRHEREGLLVAPHCPEELAAACLRILHSPNLAASLIANGQLRWPEFSVTAMIQQTEAFYTEILERTQ